MAAKDFHPGIFHHFETDSCRQLVGPYHWFTKNCIISNTGLLVLYLKLLANLPLKCIGYNVAPLRTILDPPHARKPGSATGATPIGHRPSARDSEKITPSLCSETMKRVGPTEDGEIAPRVFANSKHFPSIIHYSQILLPH